MRIPADTACWVFAAAVSTSACLGRIGEPGDHAGGASGAPGVTTGGTTVCTDTPASAPTMGPRIRRLTKLEVRNTVADLFGDTVAQHVDPFQADPRPQGFSTGDERSVNPGYMDTLREVALQIGQDFRRSFDKTKFATTCFASDTSARDCADPYLRDFGKRAYRRVLTDVDVAALFKVFDAGRATGADGDITDRFAAGLQYTIVAALQSPEFIFRTELGPDAVASGSTITLTPLELASAISYAVVASPPDATLVDVAEKGQLGKPDQVSEQARRLIASHSDRFRAQVQRFVLDWLGIDYDKPDWSNKDKTLYPNFSSAVRDALEQETAMSIADWASSGPFLPTLLTTSSGFISQGNASVYGLTSTSMSFQKQAFDPKQRAGILTSPGFLGTYAHTDSSSPVFRGVAIMRKLLCLEPPPVPAMVPPLPPIDMSSEVKTTRQRFDKHISIPFCNGCHKNIDPMGNVFESYDAVGAYRTEENGAPIDSSGGIVGSVSSDAQFGSAVDMLKALAKSADVHACFSRQVYRFSVGRIETDADKCAIESYTRAFTEKAFDLRELLAAIAASPAFSVRLAQSGAP